VSDPDLDPLVTLTAPQSVMHDILRAMLSRVRWYEARDKPTPEAASAALALVCFVLGLDPKEL